MVIFLFCFLLSPFHKVLFCSVLWFVALDREHAVHWVPSSLTEFSQIWKERMKTGHAQRKSEEWFWVSFALFALYSISVSSHLQLHREEVDLGSVSWTQGVRAGSAPSLPRRVTGTIMTGVNLCSETFPRHSVAPDKATEKAVMPLQRATARGGRREQSSSHAPGPWKGNGLVGYLCVEGHLLPLHADVGSHSGH